MLPFEQVKQKTEYPTLSSDINQYTFKDLRNKLLAHQQTQYDYYNTIQITPLSQVTNTPQSLDPSNLPVDIRFKNWNHENTNVQEYNIQYQTRLNNPFYWYENTPAKSGYYTQNEFNPYFDKSKYISPIELGKQQSFIEFHQMELR